MASESSVLRRLKAGVRRFQSGLYAEHAEAYRHAATHPQRPHTLVIACADSRVNVEALTGAGPGEVFLTRNIGNMVPCYDGSPRDAREPGEAPDAVSAVIEYAVAALKVQHIVICGHSDCGAMKALLDPLSTERLPAVRGWLQHGPGTAPVGDVLGQPVSLPGGAAQRTSLPLDRLTEENVLLQMRHLRTHSAVLSAMAGGELTISGWVYDIGSGGVRIAEGDSREFLPIAPHHAAPELPTA